jgi:hypothetical protein
MMGASNVNASCCVPTTICIVSTTSLAEVVSMLDMHVIRVADIHSVVTQKLSPIFAVPLKAEVAKFIPWRVIIMPPVEGMLSSTVDMTGASNEKPPVAVPTT